MNEPNTRTGSEGSGGARVGLAVALLLCALPSPAGAQACQVVQETAVTLLSLSAGKKCTDSGVSCASTVRIALDRTTSLPVVLWYTNDAKLRFRRFTGAAWAAAEVVPTGGITLPKSAVGTLEAAIHAFDKSGRMHVLLSDAKKVYHLIRSASAKTWTAPQAVHTITKSSLTGLKVFAGFDSKDDLHVVYWYEAGIGYVYHGLKAASGWSWTKIGGGRHIDVALEGSGAVHVSWISKLSSNPANWQAYYRRRDAKGTWLAEEKVTNEKPVAQNIGPLAIHPAVATDGKGGAHVIYPVDPPDSGGNDDGHASYTWRLGAGKWSAPKKLFANARHSAMLELVIDGAGVKYAFGLNLKCRLATAPLSGTWKTGTWNSHAGSYRFFFFDGTHGNSGAWLAYTTGREWGPVEVIHLRRKGSCACEKQGGCAPKQLQTQACGACGTRTRTCGGYCNWGAWSKCVECANKDSGPQHDGAQPKDSGPSPEAGQPKPEAGTADSRPVADAGEQGQMTGGCSCVLGPEACGSGWLVALVLAGLLCRRRRGR